VRDKIFFIYNDFHANYLVGVKKYPMLLYPVMMHCSKNEIPFGIIIFSTKSDNVLIQDGFGEPYKDKFYNSVYKILNLLLFKKLINRFFNFKRYFYFEYLIKFKNIKIAICLSPKKEFCRSMHHLQVKSVELNHAVGYVAGSHWWHRRSDFDVCRVFISLDRFSTAAMKTDFARAQINSKIIEIKHPLYSKNNFMSHTNCFLEELKSRTRGFEKIVLFTLQWGYGSDSPLDLFAGIIDQGLIHKSVINSIKRTEERVFWLIRIHPLQTFDNFTLECLNQLEKFNPNVDWKLTSDCNLPDLLSSTIISSHLTMSSQTMYDCYYFGIPSAFLCPTLRKGGFYETFGSNLTDNGIAEILELNENDILDWIDFSELKRNFSPFELINSNNQTIGISEFIETLTKRESEN
jgi:hypothetical protein